MQSKQHDRMTQRILDAASSPTQSGSDTTTTTSVVQDIIESTNGEPHGSLVPRPGTPLPECPTNIPMSERRGRAMAINAMSPADTKIRSGIPVTILMKHYLIYPDEVINRETGEVVQCVRTCILDEVGHCYKTTSTYAPEFIRRCLESFSQVDWEVGIPVCISAVQGEQGRTYHDLRVDVVGMK